MKTIKLMAIPFMFVTVALAFGGCMATESGGDSRPSTTEVQPAEDTTSGQAESGDAVRSSSVQGESTMDGVDVTEEAFAQLTGRSTAAPAACSWRSYSSCWQCDGRPCTAWCCTGQGCSPAGLTCY